MKICLSMWSLNRYWKETNFSTTDFVDFAATTKAEGVELLDLFWRDKETETLRVQEALKNNGLQMACYSATNNFAKLKSSDRLAQLNVLTESVDTAVFFEAKVVRVFSGDRWDQEVETVSDEQIHAWIIEGLKEAAFYAEKRGIMLCLENHGRFAASADQVLGIIRDVNSPALGSAFDTGNFLSVDDDPVQACDKLIRYIPHVHFKDLL
ncbi:sugar phosphate isomerase/epimerase family protein [Paenibacillus solisilvae]|uniref:Sugar phosphate isomerase/epimerase family protein n=1 Tax=Paenibacillus solisilvae TaxID=2486751 RepID=A0ABW0VYV5_9BACL